MSKTTEQEKRRIIRKIKKNPNLNPPKLTTEHWEETKKEVNVEIIRRVLCEQIVTVELL